MRIHLPFVICWLILTVALVATVVSLNYTLWKERTAEVQRLLIIRNLIEDLPQAIVDYDEAVDARDLRCLDSGIDAWSYKPETIWVSH